MSEYGLQTGAWCGALAGRRNTGVGFTVLALWHPDSSTTEGAPLPKGATPTRLPLKRSASETPTTAAARFKPCQANEVCPLLAVKAEEWTCGELVTLIDDLSSKARLVVIMKS